MERAAVTEFIITWYPDLGTASRLRRTDGAGINSSTWYFEASARDYVVKTVPAEHKDRMQGILVTVDRIKKAGGRVPGIVKTSEGKLFVETEAGASYVQAFLANDGKPDDFSELNVLGRRLAELHTVMDSVTSPITGRAHKEMYSDLSEEEWKSCFGRASEFSDAFSHTLLDARGVILEVRRYVLRQEAQPWFVNLPSLLIHGDLVPQNILFLEGDVSGFIDFFAAHPAPRIVEVGFCAHRFADVMKHDYQRVVDSILDGYGNLSARERSLARYGFFRETLNRINYICRGFLRTGSSEWSDDLERHVSRIRTVLLSSSPS